VTLQNNSYQKPKEKPTLKLLKTTPAARLGGALPSEDMPPGKYLVVCENAWFEPKGRKYRAAFQFRIVDGKYHGVAMRKWIDDAIDAGGFISPIGKYAEACAVALGRPLEESDPGEPGEFFSGRRFIVFIGFRKSERAGGGGQSSDDRAIVRKDDRDYLRVHDIISREDM
jgi:hypothetical protein